MAFGSSRGESSVDVLALFPALALVARNGTAQSWNILYLPLPLEETLMAM
jgi:hypothetical protein